MHQQMKKRKIKEEFYNLLKQNTNQLASSDIKTILWDFNTKVGEENINKPTTGNESFHNETNNDRIKRFNLQNLKVLM